MECLIYCTVIWSFTLPVLLVAVVSGGDVPVFLWSNTDHQYVMSRDHRLEGYQLTEKSPVHTLMQCAMYCHRHPACQSYNYQHIGALCELNSESEEMRPQSLMAEAGFVYTRKESHSIDLESISACSSEPCANGGQCLSLQNTDGSQTFHCLCENEWAGETCLSPVSPVSWSEWSGVWGACSVSCGEGWQQRTRGCVDEDSQTVSAGECLGLDREERLCLGLQPCPQWDQWSEWSGCSASSTCGLGQQVRTRTCLYGGIPGLDRMCMGHFVESTPCRMPSCETVIRMSNGSSTGEGQLSVYNDVNTNWGDVCADEWTQEAADTACRQIGYLRGSKALEDTAMTVISGDTYHLSEVSCHGNESALVECVHSDWGTDITCTSGTVHLQCIVDGGWNTWTEWGACSVTCAEGIQLRHRSCDYPGPQRGGYDCSGTNKESKPCILDPCPVDGEWWLWTDWGSCNTSCGGGHQQRTRECNLPKHGGLTCTGESEDWRTCNTHSCPIDCVWDPWTAWGECNITCGGGWQQRLRDTVGPFYGGQNCTGAEEEWRGCNNHSCPIDCEWDIWMDWQSCNVTCGGGQQVRLRDSIGPLHGGENCSGNVADWRECNIHHCPVDCVWTLWQEWEVCNRTCGGGWQYRERNDDGPYYGGENCTGAHTDWRTCHQQSCPVDCMWNDWTHWSLCNTTCGGGWTQRTRIKEGPQHDGKDCVGDPEEWTMCNENACPVDGYWLSWSPWSECSVSCATGTQVRNRTCVEPLHGGLTCEGNQTDIQDCFVRHCPVDGEWRVWGAWTQCTHSCGIEGTQYKTRVCRQPLYGGLDCPGTDTDIQPCNDLPCPENGFWRNWSDWAECTVSCGGGNTTRQRKCVLPLHGGSNCTGEREETDSCNTQPCPVDGYWEEWTTWAVCSVHCAGGITSRTRHCVEPMHGGLACNGSSNESRSCNDQPCPDDCYWLAWSAWNECNKTCGGGYETRLRDSVGPVHGGKDCTGDPKEWRICNNQSCAIHCVWFSWQPWPSCNVTCGGGIQSRHRDQDGPYYGGDECPGSSDEFRECSTNPCPVDCVWHTWSQWWECNVSCGGGTQKRYRNNTGPFYGGNECMGDSDQTQSCNSHPCPIAGYWGSWAEWSDCTTTCGGGTSNRDRECIPPLYGGENCTGDSEETSHCNTQLCPIPGEWLQWSSWSLCSVTCDGGIRSRSRDCNMTSYGDITAPCIGITQNNETCHEFDCAPLGKTCSDYMDRGFVDSNWVEIDPDGTFGNPSFVVFCDNSGEEKGVTVINHQYQNKTTVSGYEGPGEYQAILKYQDFSGSTISVDQLISLVDSSEHCKQYVRWECLSAVFNPAQQTLEGENKKPYTLTYWENRWGEMMNYWGDTTPDINPPRMTCSCGMTQTCQNPSHLCNCDANSLQEWRFDDGWLTVKYDLPVTSFRAGDTGEPDLEMGKFVVGPLICNGTADNLEYWYR